ncbi:MAG: hypothetical protein RIC30_13715 [Marinoscillum sp.]|uniref:hypothetical protein n=1 Tax=Marinoscillum sp. TaxID=2024838 RepID=UPI0032FDF2E4
MWNSLLFRNKVYLLLASTALICFLGYFWSFKKTYELYQENEYLNGLTLKGEHQLIDEIKVLGRQKAVVDSLKLRIIKGSSAEIFSVLVKDAERLNLRVMSIDKFNEKDVQRYECIFSGLYVNMVKFIRLMENDFKTVTLETVEFHKEFNRKTNKSELKLKLILIEKNGQF